MKTKTCMRASPLLGAALVLALATGAFAQSEKLATSARDQAATTGARDDLYPPPWRGQPGTTFQHWLFNVNQNPDKIPGTPWFPEINENPYGPPWLDTGFGDENWYDYWADRYGVMNPWASTIYLNLFNSAEPLEWKIVWIQMTWWFEGGEFNPPPFGGSEPPGDLVWEQHEPLGNGWYHTVYEIWIPGNPDFERIIIHTDHYFDQIVVDTWCTNGVEPLGACCVQGECVATTTCGQCLELGGWWYEGEDCFGESPFECPCKDALWHNGEPDWRDGVTCERRTDGSLESWVVDDVIFEEDVVVRDLHWWAVTDDAFQFQNSDDIIILTDEGGMPGQPLVELFDVYNFRYDTCRDEWGRTVYVYCIEDLEIPLPAGRYWFGMRPVNYNGSQNFNLTAAPNGTYEAYFRSEDFGYPDWTPISVVFGEAYDMAFCVTGEPASTGACCLDGNCVATTSFDECNQAGGFWYEGETCPEFECPCTADSIWDNGVPDYRDGLACARAVQGPMEAWVVDDVTFTDHVIVRDLHWWAISLDSYDWQNTDDLIILEDAGGMPGNVVYEMWDVPNTRIYMGIPNPWGYPQYYYSIEGLNIPLPPGTYWFGMRPVDQDDGGASYHLTSAPNGTNECYFKSDYFGVPDWRSSSDQWGEAYDLAFCVTGTGPGGAKYSQPIACELNMHFSNMNSNLAPWMRFDDFVCTMTGDITKVVFWGGGWDWYNSEACDFYQSLAAIRIDLFEWIPQGPCEWQHGALLCSNTIPLDALDPVFECNGPYGEKYYRFTAYLPEPCFQHEDEHYALRIAGILVDPDHPCIFGWSHTPMNHYGLAYGLIPPDDWYCGGPDHAFELYTEQAPCPWDFDGDADVDTADLLHLLGCWGTPCGDVDGDNDTDTADLLALLGHWGDCP